MKGRSRSSVEDSSSAVPEVAPPCQREGLLFCPPTCTHAITSSATCVPQTLRGEKRTTLTTLRAPPNRGSWTTSHLRCAPQLLHLLLSYSYSEHHLFASCMFLHPLSPVRASTEQACWFPHVASRGNKHLQGG